MKKALFPVLLAVVALVSAQPYVASADVACLRLAKNYTQGVTSGGVTLLQDFLRSEGYLENASTGYFGALTLKAVKKFQTDQSFPVTGFVGPMTRGAMEKISCSTQASATTPQQPAPAPQAQVAAAAQTVTPPTPPPAPQIVPPYRTTSFKSWEPMWGSVSLNSDLSLNVNAATTTTGGEAVFTDSKNWTDYRYAANVTINNGDIELMGRWVDDDNFVECVFNRNEIYINQRIDGKDTQLNSTTVEDMPGSPVVQRSTSVALRVKGDTIGCTAFGPNDNVTAKGINPKLMKGGIGIATWQPGKGVAKLQLTGIDVTVE